MENFVLTLLFVCMAVLIGFSNGWEGTENACGGTEVYIERTPNKLICFSGMGTKLDILDNPIYCTHHAVQWMEDTIKNNSFKFLYRPPLPWVKVFYQCAIALVKELNFKDGTYKFFYIAGCIRGYDPEIRNGNKAETPGDVGHAICRLNLCSFNKCNSKWYRIAPATRGRRLFDWPHPNPIRIDEYNCKKPLAALPELEIGKPYPRDLVEGQLKSNST